LTSIGDYVFRVCFTDDFQGAVLARFASEDLRLRTAVVFTDISSEYSIGLSQIFRTNFEKLGGLILDEIEYKLKQSDYSVGVQRAKRSGAAVVLLSGHYESGQIAKALQQAGFGAIPLGGDGWGDSWSTGPFLANGGDKIPLGYFSSHWAEQVESQRSRDFVRAYKSQGSFGTGTALAYDATMVVADAIRRAGSSEPKEIRNALAATDGFPGITGSITFDAQGDPLKSAVIMSVHKGQITYLKTLHPDR
jgi:branched-chain amino acid transport system substrate-binding protein